MNEQRKKEYNELLNGEKEIKNELKKPGGLEKGYKTYYLLDYNWVENYKALLANNNFKKFNNLLNVNLIIEKGEDKDFSYVHHRFKFTFPYNFTLVTENFIDLLCKNFNKKEQKELKIDCFKIIIGGKCLIMKDPHNEMSSFAYITLYNEKKEKFNNNIDYFLKIDDREELKNHLNYILNNNIWNYFKKINYSYKEECQRFTNNKGKTIGYLVLNNSCLNQIEEIYNYNYMKENININIDINKRMDINEMHDINIDKIYSFLLCLHNNKEIYNELKIYYKDKKIIKMIIDFVFSKNVDKIKEYFLESIKSNDYKIIINDIFEKIDSELSNENKNDFINKQDCQVYQYDEIRRNI